MLSFFNLFVYCYVYYGILYLDVLFVIVIFCVEFCVIWDYFFCVDVDQVEDQLSECVVIRSDVCIV